MAREFNKADAMTVAGRQLKEYQEIASEAPLKMRKGVIRGLTRDPPIHTTGSYKQSHNSQERHSEQSYRKVKDLANGSRVKPGMTE